MLYADAQAEAQQKPRHTLNTTQIGIMILVLHTTILQQVQHSHRHILSMTQVGITIQVLHTTKDPHTMIQVPHATESSITTIITIMAEIQLKVAQVNCLSL